MNTTRTIPDTYLYPPRAQDAIPFAAADFFADQGWQAQLKYNDSHCLIKYTPTSIQLWNRHGQPLAYTPSPELYAQLNTLRDKLNITGWTLLDGGLLHAKHTAIKHTLVLWDLLVHNGSHLLGSTYASRYDFLVGKLDTTESWYYRHPNHSDLNLGIKATPDILIPRNYTTYPTWQTLWDTTITTANKPYPQPVLEGLVFKNLTGTLENGLREKNNAHWLCRSRVTTRRHQF